MLQGSVNCPGCTHRRARHSVYRWTQIDHDLSENPRARAIRTVHEAPVPSSAKGRAPRRTRLLTVVHTLPISTPSDDTDASGNFSSRHPLRTIVGLLRHRVGTCAKLLPTAQGAGTCLVLPLTLGWGIICSFFRSVSPWSSSVAGCVCPEATCCTLKLHEATCSSHPSKRTCGTPCPAMGTDAMTCIASRMQIKNGSASFKGGRG
jgi:hypothetical protein